MGNFVGRHSPEEQPGRRKRKAGPRKKKKKDEFLDSNRKRPELAEEDEEEGQQMALQDIYGRLPHRRLATRKTLSVARWHPDRGLAEAMVMKGNMWQNMGIVRHGRNYCQVEEALYMVERGSLLLLLGPQPSSIQEAHSLLLHQGLPLQAHTVYSKLRKLGYIIQRYEDPWVHPVSQNRRKVEAERKEDEKGGAEAEGNSADGGGGVEKEEPAECSGVQVKKENKAPGGEAKKKEKGAKERKDGSSKWEPSESSLETNEEAKADEKNSGIVGKNREEESVDDADDLDTKSQVAAVGLLPPPAQSAERPPGLGDAPGGASASSTCPGQTNQQQDPSADSGSAILSAAIVDGKESASLNGDSMLEDASDTLAQTGSQPQTKPSTILPQEREPTIESAPALTEETVTNAGTEDFRKASQEKGARKRRNPGPLDLNQACTFVNLNVKNYHPLAPYLFLGKPKRRYAGRKQATESKDAAKGGPGEVKTTEDLVNETLQRGDGPLEVPQKGNAATQSSEISQGDHSSIQVIEADNIVTLSTEGRREVILEVSEAGLSSEKIPEDEIRLDIKPDNAIAPSKTTPSSEKRTPVDVGALHELLDMSRCTMPPPIPKASMWQKLIWRLRRVLRWRWWPWSWVRGTDELGMGRMRPLARHLEKKAKEPRVKRVFPETEVSVQSREAVGAVESRKTDSYSELKVADEDDRLALIAAGKSIVYNVWQPNSRFRKTDPGPPSFRLILGGIQPPTRREVHVYKVLYGQDGVPLKYCFVESTGASTYFSFDPVAVPPVL